MRGLQKQEEEAEERERERVKGVQGKTIYFIHLIR